MKLTKNHAKLIAKTAMESAGFGITMHAGYHEIWSDEKDPDHNYAVAINKEDDNGRQYFAIYVSPSLSEDSYWEYTETIDEEELVNKLLEIAGGIDAHENESAGQSNTENPIKIEFCSTIYFDALSLLFSDKTDIKEVVRDQMMQNDYEMDQIRSDAYFEEELLDVFDAASIDSLMNYIIINESDVVFDYGESAACGDLRTVAFEAPCTFDYSRWKENLASDRAC